MEAGSGFGKDPSAQLPRLGELNSLMRISCDRDGIVRSWCRECEVQLGHLSADVVGISRWHDLFSRSIMISVSSNWIAMNG